MGREIAADLGQILSVMARAGGQYPTWRAHEIVQQIGPALALRQAHIFHNDGGPIGFATWAFLIEEDGQRFIETTKPPVDIERWRGGTDLWLIDFAALDGSFEQIRHWMAINWHPCREVHTLRHGGRHIVHSAYVRARRRRRALALQGYTEELRHAGE